MEVVVGTGDSATGSSDGSGLVDNSSTCDHDFSVVGYDDYIHWRQCSKCGEKEENSEQTHTLGNAVDNGGTSGTHSVACTFNACSYSKIEAHTFGADGNCTVPGCTATN